MRRPWQSLVLYLTALSVFVCSGQVASLRPAVPAEHAQTYSLSGTVTNAATGEPIRRALVHVNGPVQLAAFTGPDGRFQISGVPQGEAFVTAEKPGFFDEQALHPGFYAPQITVISVAAGMNELHLHLTPEARI